MRLCYNRLSDKSSIHICDIVLQILSGTVQAYVINLDSDVISANGLVNNRRIILVYTS